MAARGVYQSNHHKSLIEDLEQRIYELKHFDAASEVNYHCDDLVGQVMLTIESAMEHLNKVQTRMVNEINDYRHGLLGATSKKQPDFQEEFKKLSQEIAAFKSKASISTASSLSSDALKEINDLQGKTNQLRKHMRANAFNGSYMRLLGNDFLEDGIIGSLVKTQKDVQDDFAIKDVVLDELISLAQVSGPFASATFDSEEQDVTAVLYLEDGNIVFATSGSLFIWDPESKQTLFEPDSNEHEACITALVQLPNGYLVTGDEVGWINVWDLKARKHLYFFDDIEEEVLWFKVTPTGKLVCCANDIYAWGLGVLCAEPIGIPRNKRKEIRLDLFDLYEQIKAWNVLSDERETNYLSKYYKLIAWTIDQEVANLEVSFEALSNGHLAFSYLTPADLNIIIWDPETGRSVKEITITGNDIQSCTILPDGDAVICHEDNRVDIYSLEEGKVYQSFRNDKGPILAIKQQSRRSLLFVHLQDPQLPFIGEGQAPHMLSPSLTATCLSKDGKQMAVGYTNEKLVIWPLKG